MKRIIIIFLSTLAAVFCVCGCSNQRYDEPEDAYRVYYEIFVGSYADSDGDGIGDLKGVAGKLDYVEELGATGIYLMPIMPSESYHKYDVDDYMSIDPQYGSMEDFDALIKECHSRDIRLIVDMVVNHTSDTNPWFVAACEYLRGLPKDATPSALECPYYEYYNFTKEPRGGAYHQVPGTDYYYEGVFFDGMPDLNLRSDALMKELYSIFDFWIAKGVDGFRMDAVLHFSEDDQDFNIAKLGELNSYCVSQNADFVFVNEVWSSETTIAKYYDSKVSSIFNFDLAGPNGRIIKAARGKCTAESLAEAMIMYEQDFGARNSEYVDAPFITNHDMGRVANALVDDTSKIKFAGGLNLIMRGSPYIYYGEEIGMKSKGDKDENKRLAMPWVDIMDSGDNVYVCQNPADADEGIEQTLGTVESQGKDKNSILAYYRNAIKLRRQNPAIARGTTQLVGSFEDGNIVVIKRTDANSFNLIVINTGEAATIDMSKLDAEAYGFQLDSLKLYGAMLTDTGDQAVFKKNILSIPAKGIVIFR